MTHCLADETVWKFVEGTLPASDFEAVESHLSGCSDCLGLVVDTANLLFEERNTGVLSSGVTVSRYVIGKIMGAGGVGIVYSAYDPQLKRKVALKLVWPARSISTKDDQPRLLREAQAMARLSHPNVVNVHDTGTFHDKVFIVMELVEGITLQAWLAGAARPWRQVLDAFLAAGRGLAAAHAAQLVHRDFKPENVLMGVDGRVRVTDFGLAEDDRSLPDDGANLAGTPAYMAPEQFLGKSLDARADQFSFCVSLYKALYGERPFESGTGSLLTGKVRRLSSTNDAPAWIASILARGLEVQPESRYDSMDGLLDAIDQRLERDATRKKLVRFMLPAVAAIGLVSIIWQCGLRGQDVTRHSGLVAPICGNGKIETGEQCDDANRSDSDSCLSTCKFATCGDGRVRTGVEDCDDGNQRDGDDCSSHCLRCVEGDSHFSLSQNGHCYMRYDMPQTWKAASATCRSAGAHLITFTAGFEIEAAHQNLILRPGTRYWIGLHDPSGTHNYVWTTGEVDRLSAPVLTWTVNTPQPKGGCAAIQKPPGEWETMSCDSALGFICEKDNWILRPENNHAYRPFGREETWNGARNLCQRIGTHLLTLADAQESAFVHARLPGPSWAGAIKTSAGAGFQWITGEAVAPSLFGAGDPNEVIVPACVILAGDLSLYDRPCDGSDDRGPYRVICESD